MAALCSSPPLFSLQHRSSPSCSLAVPSRPLCLLTCHKETMGTSLLLQSLPLLEDSSSRRRRGRLTVEAAKRVDKGRTFLLSSTLKAQEAEVKKVAQLCEGIRQWASEKQKDKQSGLKKSECYVDTFENNVFHFLEEYCSHQQMNDVHASPEYMKFWEDVRPLLLEPIALAVYGYKDGRIGPNLNPIGPKGEGGLDDATGQGGRGGEEYMKPKAKVIKESKDLERSDVRNEKAEEPDSDKWNFEKILAKVTGADTTKADGWNIKTLFGGKK